MTDTKSFLWPQLRTLLVLGRASNLPTVWSNCLAGWILGGGGGWVRFAALLFGATCLYVGGMYLNDAFDAEFDRQHKKDRPIPSGAITVERVWLWGAIWMGLGVIPLGCLGFSTFTLTLLLTGCILIYDAIHKVVTFAPIVMAGCRFFLFLAAASAGRDGVTGLAVWAAIALTGYIIGLSYIARKESTAGPIRFWPAYLLALPVVLTLIVNVGEFASKATMLSLLFGLWVAICLRQTFWVARPNPGRTVSGLLAGIVLVDIMALGGGTLGQGVSMILLFWGALLFQRVIPAT